MNRPTPVLLRVKQLKTYERGNGARTTPLVTPAVGSTGFITGYTAFDPGVAIPYHSHNCEESVVLIEGDAVLDINGEEHHLDPLDATWIPANVPHRFRNLSDSKPMKILWIYASPNATRTITETGATAPVSAEHNK